MSRPRPHRKYQMEHRTVLKTSVILSAVAKAANLQIYDVAGPDRHDESVMARRVVVELFREFRSDLNLSAMGRILKRHHATVINSFDRIALDSELHAKVREGLLALTPETAPQAFLAIAVSVETEEAKSLPAVNSRIPLATVPIAEIAARYPDRMRVPVKEAAE